MSGPEIRSEPLGGSPLSLAVADGMLPQGWSPRPPVDAAGWRSRMLASGRGSEWLRRLRPALDPGGAAIDRLLRVAASGGVVVTTGQQPGLFGGPLYTWYKALSARALADELEQATGIPCAAVFWAATDDADLAEAATTTVVRGASVETLHLPHPHPHASSAPLSEVRLGDLGDALRALEEASGATVYPEILELARSIHRPEQTVGGAYIELLRAVLGTYEICVLDAAHPAVADAADPLLRQALQRAGELSQALRERDFQLRRLGHTPQVADVAGLSLVFQRRPGDRQRVRLAEAARAGGEADAGTLGPNVLLRPVMERSILPTVAYVAGPGELAYFAQAGAVADVLGLEPPLAVPRWSGTIMEPHVLRLLEGLGLRPEDAVEPHATLSRLAREALPPAIRERMRLLRAALDDGVEALAAAAERESPPLVERDLLEGHRRILQRRLDRLERRLVAAQKRRLTDAARALAVLQAALRPSGKRQERVLNLLPLLARHGPSLLDLVLARAREHAAGRVQRAAEAAQPS